jgi:ATP-dependent RNA helicase RhlE
MPKYDYSESKSEKKNTYKSSSNRTTDYYPNAGKSTSYKPSYSKQPKRPLKEFNPLLFIQKPQEQIASEPYIAKNTFADFLLEQRIQDNIIAKGYKAPTAIQDQAIPVILQGKDVIATANTGTGKTAAFLIPLIQNVLTKKTKKVLIITPTRELADQIQSELNTFKRNTGLLSVLCIGGLSTTIQIQNLQRNPAFVIGTPGRLKDLEKNGYIRLSAYDAIVLDEVDTMLDMGFINDIEYIIQKLPQDRHSLFFSATIPTTLNRIMSSFVRNAVSISVKTRQSAANVHQEVIKVDQQNKIELLHDLLIKPEFKKVILFLKTKRAADKLSRSLRERGFEIATIHGDKTQGQRRKALALFKDNMIKILLATDVVARGIDIDDVSHVINFDLPQTYEDYIHRIGRTGRAEKTGQAITFIG